MSKPETRKAMMQAQRDEQIAEANKRKAEAEAYSWKVFFELGEGG